MDELFGVVNVPSGIWISDDGTVVRPPETAYPRRPGFLEREPRQDDPPHVRERIDPERDMLALRDWVTRGVHSEYALAPEEVLRRARGRTLDEALAAAHFELGQYLYRTRLEDQAVPHFREAHRLQPDNWTYKRQEWSLADPSQGPTPLYVGDWLADVRRIGAENYYAALDM